jgi:aldoxime dehydratase
MESAIPDHLKTVRTRQPRVADDYVPPYPSFVARFKPNVTRVVMAYFGLQFLAADERATTKPLAEIAGAFKVENGPGHWDRARYTDEAGYETILTIAYWDDTARFDRWFSSHGATWSGAERSESKLGFFAEILRPAVTRYETLFSSAGRMEGVAVVADRLSDMVQEHAYWGGMRDRIPVSQTDAMVPHGTPCVTGANGHLRVVPHENICLIRSGQDWADADESERKLYFGDVESVLRAGMNFLRDEGLSCGCFANRYMRVVDADGKPVEKSFGMSWWKSLESLERWAESHPTHVAIFGAAMKYLMALGPAAKLRLYHEVTVATADEQFFEYRNCHPKTGMLRAV